MKWLTLFAAGFMMSSSNAYAETTATQRAIFAGGCFWCIEAELQELEGVDSVTSGYTGGSIPNPTYEQTSQDTTGHAEAVEVVFHPDKISYEKLLEVYWGNIDPTDEGGQFYDRGAHYRTEIFYLNDEQKLLAESSKMRMQEILGQAIVTQVTPASTFYPAESYHQDYYKTNPLRYKAYKYGSGREKTLNKIWGENRPGKDK